METNKTDRMYEISREIYFKIKELRKQMLPKGDNHNLKEKEAFKIEEDKLKKEFEIKCRQDGLL